MSTPAAFFSEALDELGLEPLPDQAMALLARLDAPPRLIAHLALVHDAAVQLTVFVVRTWPGMKFDASAALLGAALHDIGKIAIPQELSEAGRKHEEAGCRLLLGAGIEPRIARFARTHAADVALAEGGFEDWLVALADTCWKGKRDPALEDRLAAVIAEATGSSAWDVWLRLDRKIERIAASADDRLMWQFRFPETRSSQPLPARR